MIMYYEYRASLPYLGSQLHFIAAAFLAIIYTIQAAFKIWYCRRQNQGRQNQGGKEITPSLHLVFLGLEHDPSTYSRISINRQLPFRFHTGTDI